MTQPESRVNFLQNLAKLSSSYSFILVHGGGPEISAALKTHNIEPKFKNGLRVTDKNTMSITEMILTGKVNPTLVGDLEALGVKSVGISGRSNKTLLATSLFPQKPEYGYVGKVEKVQTELIEDLSEKGYLIVLSPIGTDKTGQAWNVNADHAAKAVSAALGADEMIFLTDVDGVMVDGKVVHSLNTTRTKQLIEQKIIYGGMIPKVESALFCLQQGVKKVVILNGQEKDILPRYFSSQEKIGTVFQ